MNHKTSYPIPYTPYPSRRGMTALPTLLVLSSIIIEVAIAIALAAYLLSNVSSGARYGAEALAAANAGVSDATIRIARDKNYSSGGYTFSVGSSTTSVVVQINTGKDGTAATGKSRILSTGTTRTFSKKLEVVYSVNDITGEMTLETYDEIGI